MENNESIRSLSAQIINASKRLYERGLNTSNTGTISARIDAHRILITPANVDMGALLERDLAVIELLGDKHVSGPKPSPEYVAHAHIYRLATKVNAVVQAHPEVSLSLIAARGKTALNLQIDEEAALYLGNVATVQKLPSTSAAFASSIATRIARGNATTVIMEGHGTLAVGSTVHEALGRVEMLEHIATKRMLYYLLKGR